MRRSILGRLAGLVILAAVGLVVYETCLTDEAKQSVRSAAGAARSAYTKVKGVVQSNTPKDDLDRRVAVNQAVTRAQWEAVGI